MKKHFGSLLSIACCVFFATTLYAQNKTTTSPIIAPSPTLFYYGNDSVSKQEFMYVYEKHNAQDPARFSQKSIDDYLDLYTKFKIKVKEAELLGIDTTTKVTQQLSQYQHQLAQTYLNDKEITDKLLLEAYERLQKEVKVSHLLLTLPEDASPADTAAMYKKIMEIRERIVKKNENFAKVAKEVSQDPSVKDNQGDLGYITALQTVYPFETAAYNTRTGSVSMPIRTKFGYHLVKPTDIRKARGKIKVAHILLKATEKDDTATQNKALRTANEVYKKLLAGEQFEKLAHTYSNDNSSKASGGELPEVESGRMIPEFEEAAFALQKDGDFSKPVKTPIGWHIIKLVNKRPIGSFEDLKPDLKKRIERDSRSWISKKDFVKKLKNDYKYKENATNLQQIKNTIDTTLQRAQWKAQQKAANLNQPIFTLSYQKNTDSYTQGDFAHFVEQNQSKVTRDAKSNLQNAINILYDNFVEEKVMELEESLLEYKNPEFAKLMKEFRDGTLLFELTERNVWNKAIEDTTGLKTFYEKNKTKYMWQERAEASFFNCATPEIAKTVRKSLTSTKFNADKLKAKLNKKAPADKPNLRIETALYEKTQNEMVDKTDWKAGSVNPQDFNGANNTIVIVRINKIVPPEPKKLDETRGYVVSDFQNELEKQWVDNLKAKYPIKINQSVLKNLYSNK